MPTTVRETMSDLIAYLRLLVNDPSGATATFTDLQLQEVLDQNAYQAMYEQLSYLENIQPGGLIEYKKYCAAHGYWESDVVLTNGTYVVLTPATSDLKVGLWTFNISILPPVLVYGIWYDMNGAAADVWEMKAALFAEQFDANIDGANSSLSQKQAQALVMAKKYRMDAVNGQGIAHLRRSDVAN